ncbi:MAG: VacJ family lipoprotein [Planctomycetes bacterium]|nr:VacJ family lipoprotein [Planctomycetota bacterium]
MSESRTGVLSRAVWVRAVLLCLLPAVAACAFSGTERRAWKDYDGPGAEHFLREEMVDLEILGDFGEPTNRAFRNFNHFFTVALVDPLYRGYRWVLPEAVRNSIGRLGRNLAYPKRLVNNLLQGRFAGAGTETLRFLINTTVGIVGLFDPASGLLELEPSEASFSQTFDKWGWDGSQYLVVPILDRGSDRDTPAALLDMAFNPGALAPGLSLLLKVDREGARLDDYRRLYRTCYDPYAFLHIIFQLGQGGENRAFKYEAQKCSEAETIKEIFFRPKDEDFASACEDDEVLIAATAKQLPYSYILQPEPAPIVFILPGLGGHRDSEASLALMEMVHRHGFSAAAISSTMCCEFMESAATVAVPGYGPCDAADVHAALDAICKQLQEEHPGRITRKGLLGLSLGGYHALLIAAAAQAPGNALMDFDRYVAVSPPVSLRSSIAELDECFHAPEQAAPGDRAAQRAWANETGMKVLRLVAQGVPAADPIPLSALEARFVIGLYYRLQLMFVIHCSQSRHDLGVLQTDLGSIIRGPSYEEIFDYSFLEYLYAFVLPYYAKEKGQVSGPEELIRKASLTDCERLLRKNKKVRLFANEDDILLAEADRAWLRKLQAHFFPDGGHTGNLWRTEVQERIMEELSDLAPGK